MHLHTFIIVAAIVFVISTPFTIPGVPVAMILALLLMQVVAALAMERS